MAYVITSSAIAAGSQAIADTSTTQRHPLGTIVTAYDPTYGAGEFIYLLGVASTVVGSAATYNADDFSTTLTVADAIGPIGFAMSINVASQYGWYQISGKAVAKTGTVADDANVYLTSTPGQLDDAVVDGDMVHLAKFASANGTPSAGLAEIEISRPYSDNITTND
jgi:hypothetical protein